jgi:hypothetical protein
LSKDTACWETADEKIQPFRMGATAPFARDFFMLMNVVAGIACYFKLGRSEDPDFTVKTMVVESREPAAPWRSPKAT